MKTGALFVFLSLLCFAAGARGDDREFFGTFRGILRHHQIGRDQHAKLDFILDRKSGNLLDIAAVLTLRFGGPSSSEYVSYTFDSVRYNVLTSTLVFDQADQGVTLLVSRFDGKRLEATFRAPLLDPAEATLILEREATVPIAHPLLGELGGTYRGEKSILALETYRSTEERTERENPFAENEIRGRLVRENRALGGLVTHNTFSGGSYDFFKGTVTLIGGLEPLFCTVDRDDLVCEGERFRHVPEPIAPVREPSKAPWAAAAERGPGTPPTPHPVKGLAGRYWGYLHHEGRALYQLADLNIAVVPGSAATPFQLSVAASLHFGDPSGKESLCYKFESRDFDLIAGGSPLFRRPGVDAMVRVTSMNGGVIRGIWYSRFFGRVGTFEFHRDKPPSLPTGARLLGALSGTRDSEIWRMQLRVVPRPAVTRSSNPFSPLSFTGIFWDRQQIVLSKSPMLGGSYDFYTGRIALPLSAAGENVVLTGEHDSEGTLSFSFNLSNRYGTTFRPQRASFPDRNRRSAKL